jgi:hypothetical protein
MKPATSSQRLVCVMPDDMWIFPMMIRETSGRAKRSPWGPLLIAAGLLTSGASFATDDRDAHPGIEALLRKVEQRVSAKHMMSPEGDSALDAWQQVLLVIPTTDVGRVRNALKNIAVHWRRRANDEQHDGNIAVSAGLSIFASQAESMMPGKSGATVGAETTAGDVALGPSPSTLPPVVPFNAEQTVAPGPELLTEALAEPPQRKLASTPAAPMEVPRVHQVFDAHPHFRRRHIDVTEARTPRINANGVIQELLY